MKHAYYWTVTVKHATNEKVNIENWLAFKIKLHADKNDKNELQACQLTETNSFKTPVYNSQRQIFLKLLKNGLEKKKLKKSFVY